MPTQLTVQAENRGDTVMTATDGVRTQAEMGDPEEQIGRAGRGLSGRGDQGLAPACPGVTCRPAS
jgi:hypothetical protein